MARSDDTAGGGLSGAGTARGARTSGVYISAKGGNVVTGSAEDALIVSSGDVVTSGSDETCWAIDACLGVHILVRRAAFFSAVFAPALVESPTAILLPVGHTAHVPAVEASAPRAET